MKFILLLILIYCTDKITAILTSKYYAKKCNYNCKNCKMWSCTYETNYPNFKLPPYDNFSKYCGKENKNV